VFITVLYSCSDQLGRTLRADQILLSVLASRCHIVAAVVHAAEVGLLALEAVVVGAFEHRIGLKVAIEAIVRIPKTLVFVDSFEFGSLKSFLLNDCSDLFDLGQLTLKWQTVVHIHRMLASRAVHEREDNSWRSPFALN